MSETDNNQDDNKSKMSHIEKQLFYPVYIIAIILLVI